MFISRSPLINKRCSMAENYRKDEDSVIKMLLPVAELSPLSRSQAWDRARDLVLGIRLSPLGKGGVDALLNEFALSSDEGIVLMCLAEALLRIPDKVTTDRLIRDKLGSGDWVSHLGNSDSFFVNASAWGLLLTGKVVSYKGPVLKKAETADGKNEQQASLLKRTINRLGEPVIRSSVRTAMQIMGAQFVMGTTIEAAISRAQKQETKGYRYSYDMLGEGARTLKDAEAYMASYLEAIKEIGIAAAGRGPIQSPGISVKLSALHPRYQVAHRQRVMSELVPRLKILAMTAANYDIGLTVDAEEADRLDLSLDVIEAVFRDPDLLAWQGFGIAIQAYQKRALDVVDWAKALAELEGRKMMVRLVKGAYWDSEIKWSQIGGFSDYPVFTRKPSTDVSYQACARRLLSYRDQLYPQFASHNAYTVATILALDKLEGDPSKQGQGYEFQRLHGMGEALYDQVMEEEGIPCRIYAPVGEHANLLAYLVRRLLENGANSSFVNNIVDEAIPIESLIDDPVEIVKQWNIKRNEKIPLPKHLYFDSSSNNVLGRENSSGDDLSDIETLRRIKQSMDAWWHEDKIPFRQGDVDKEMLNPSKLSESIGSISYASEAQMLAQLRRSEESFPTWTSLATRNRANLLRDLGSALENRRYDFAALCIKEAGKTLADGLSEVREAVDFCRYYADQSELLFKDSTLQSRGIILCISPWNFPLAIFLGQVSAALVTGNTVIAKPAEQTSLIALALKDLMIEVGFPESVMEVIVSPGKPVGDIIVSDKRVKAVLFTGSTGTAKVISQLIANRSDTNIPFVAETGGQNVMIVDSTALPEQVVDDVIVSAFQSAGQRCSALRVLYLQEDIADSVIEMIKGAMQELLIGNPIYLDTDIGPVIDAFALARLHEHVEYLASLGDRAKCLHSLQLDESLDGYYFPPKLYEIDDVSLLKEEVFGPVVHVIRFRATDLDLVVNEINQSGYGLTLGIHSRIQSVSEEIASKVKVGNVYVNRNMIGAVVGVQPFGGRGLSGTGPKAGGPSYLAKLTTRIPKGIADKAQHESRLIQFSGSRAIDEELIGDMIRSQANWASTDIYQRVSVIRRVLSNLSKESLLMNEIFIPKEQLAKFVADAEELISVVNKLESLPLLGPTGESNILSYEARGILALVWEDSMPNAEFLLKSFTSLLTGNAVNIVSTSANSDFMTGLEKLFAISGLPKHVITSFEDSELTLLNEAVVAVVISDNSAYQKSIEKILVKRDGALTSVIQGVEIHDYLTEKTLSIDTTAAGGNASLMTM
ncbi:MAG: RHH-type proline utilization regulon transcriptional repressor/proline dehydrogenase [Candidatus Azotimanducaceae bacterium]|jgi:RHH-type proline utilization regulon transcriptional repressor/proline dehydrogenase/delta 1-pyrroline-5-carboxylate dehydrogenase